MYTFYFENMAVWKVSKELAKSIYKITDKFPDGEKYGLVSQLRRAIVSVPTNISEGISRSTKKDQAYYTTVAYSSLMETLNLLIISKELNYVEERKYLEQREIIEKIANMLNSLRKTQLKRKR